MIKQNGLTTVWTNKDKVVKIEEPPLRDDAKLNAQSYVFDPIVDWVNTNAHR